jgi:hypothetical protein
VSITRRSVIGRTILGALAAPAGEGAQEASQTSSADEGQQFFLRLLKANDDAVGRMLNQPSGGRGGAARVGRGENIAALAAAYCSPESSYYRGDNLIALMERGAQALVDAQNPDGLLDAGNLDSPPDTGFVVEATAASLEVARRRQDARLTRVTDTLSKFLLKVGDGLVTGGIHTPNHRWVVCAALARINSLFPAAKYVNRIDDWLGEGIYQDADGQFPERSPNYARVEVNAFVTLARLLNRPALLDSSSTLCEAKWRQLIDSIQGHAFQREILVSRMIA